MEKQLSKIQKLTFHRPPMVQLLKAALNEVSDSVLVTDEFGRFLYFNKGFGSFHRLRDSEFKADVEEYTQIFEVTTFDGTVVPFESWPVSRALRGEVGVNEELKVIRRETGDSWIGLYNFSPIRDASGKIVGSVTVGRDITQGKIAEKKLKDVESRARLLLEKSTEVIVGLNLDGTYCLVNDSYARMLKTTPEQIIGRSVKGLVPDSRASERMKAMREAIESRQKKTVELTLKDGDGNERIFLTNVEPIFDENGDPQWVMFVALDITERKAADLRMAESEAKYRRLFEQNSDALLLFDIETREILDANPAAEKLYGYSCRELVGSNMIDLATNPVDFEQTIIKASRQGFYPTSRQSHRKKNGQVFPIEITMTLFQLGNRVVMLPIIRDISERKQVEDRLNEISRRLQLATNSARIGIWDWDIKSDTILWDDRMLELYGKPTTDTQKRGVNEWADQIHPDDRERVFKACLAATQSKENVFDTEFRIVRPDKSIVHLKANGLVVWNEDGAAERMIGTNADITRQKEGEIALRKAYSEIEAKVRSRTTELTRESERLKESERRLKRAQELGRIGHWSTMIEDLSSEWSDEVYRIFGLEPQSIQPNRELFSSLILPEYRDKTIKVIDDAFELKKSYAITFPFQRPDGSVGIAHSMAEVEVGADGRPYKYSGVLQDVTEQKTLEKDLRAAVELRDEFMSIASHELKTPLTALNMQLQLLERFVATASSAIDQRILKMSKGALNSVKSISNLIDDLLDVTRIRAGKLTLSKEDVDLKILLEKIVNEMQPEAQRASTQIILLASESVHGEWDLARIVQIVRNLITNAIKYGKGSPVVVSLKYDGNEARITVKDGGIGISKELQALIFERFQRAASGNKITGLGLGLYIVRQIVEAHGGSVQVESEPNKGSLFTVKLPRNYL